MRENRWAKAAATLEAATLVAAAVGIALYIAVALLRMAYPFELEWMEGGSLGSV